MHEEMVLSADGIYKWNGPKSKSTLKGTKLGRLVLTNQRLVFLSSGTNDMAQRALGGAMHGGVGGLLAAGSTDDLDPGALGNEGSLSVPIGDLEHFQFVKKMFRNYLSIRFTTASGDTVEAAFMNQYALPGGPAWEEEIARLKQQTG